MKSHGKASAAVAAPIPLSTGQRWLAPATPLGTLNSWVTLGETLCLLLAGVVGQRWSAAAGAIPMTLGKSLLLSVLAAHPYHMLTARDESEHWARWRPPLREAATVLLGLAAGTLSAGLVAWTFDRDGTVGRWFGLWAAIALAELTGLRLAVCLVVRQLRRRGALTTRVAIVGSGPEGQAVIDHLRHIGDAGLVRIVGIFDDHPGRRLTRSNRGFVAGGLDTLMRLARRTPIDTVIVALPLAEQQPDGPLLHALHSLAVDILLLVDPSWLAPGRPFVGSLFRHPFLTLVRRPLSGFGAVAKTIEDYVVASLGLIAAAPLMLAIAVALKLEGQGPVLFRQRRVGARQQVFDMLKFRSMVGSASDSGIHGTQRDDPRLTRVGAFIRRFSLDELPQLFNVLKGEMSIVGPRAHVPDMRVGERTYAELVPEYLARHRVKPGITGWAQINGMRGGIHDAAKARRGAALDLEYVENWSLWLDCRIILRTLFGGLWGRDVF